MTEGEVEVLRGLGTKPVSHTMDPGRARLGKIDEKYPRMVENLLAGPSNCWNHISSRYSNAKNSSGLNNLQLRLGRLSFKVQWTVCSQGGVFIGAR